MQLYTRFAEPDLAIRLGEVMSREWKDYEDYLSKYSDSEHQLNFYVVMNFFEVFGGLLKKQLIDPSMVYEIVPTNAYSFWSKYEGIVNQVRLEANWPQYLRPVEFLAMEMRKIAAERGELSDVGMNVLLKYQEKTSST